MREIAKIAGKRMSSRFSVLPMLSISSAICSMSASASFPARNSFACSRLQAKKSRSYSVAFAGMAGKIRTSVEGVYRADRVTAGLGDSSAKVLDLVAATAVLAAPISTDMAQLPSPSRVG
jgi:hypothetical protein